MCGDTRGSLWLFDYTNGGLLSQVKSHPDRITGLSISTKDQTLIACSKDSFINVFSLEQSLSRLEKKQSLKSNALNIVYETDQSRLLGYNGLYCILWDAERDISLLKVNTKGGNRPVRAWNRPLQSGG